MATKKTVSKANPYFKVSLGSVAKKWNPMRKADLKRTIINKQIMLQNAREDYNTLTKQWLKATPNQNRAKDKSSINLNRIATNNNIKSLMKEIKSLNKTAQKRK